MEIQDILEGEKSVIVKTDSRDYEFKKNRNDKVVISVGTPQKLISKLREKESLELVETDETKIIKRYIHDEPTPSVKNSIAEELGADTDSEFVKLIANVGYEIELKIEVEPNSIKVTHVFGKKLEEPHEIF